MADNNESTVLGMVRRFAGADPAAEDTVLEMCYHAAVAWYEEAGVTADPTNQLWLFWVCNLAAWMYDNRGNADANAAIPIYIVTSVHQLRKPAVTGGTGATGTETGETAQQEPGGDGA